MTTVFFVSVIVSALMSCSTQKNTARNRWWHSFNAKYNTYFNGSQAYIDASLEKEKGNKDNCTELLPLYTVGNKASRSLGNGNYDVAITKAQKAIKQHSIKTRPEWNKNRKKTERDIEWLGRKEYNPFIWKAWMMMGRSQFYKGSFDEAAATFSYMSRLYRTQPAIYGKARAWLAKCYIEQDWMYDAEDIIRNMKRDSIDWHAQKEWDYTMASYYLHNEEWEKAVPVLKKVIKHEMRAQQRAREWFIMGQVQTLLNNNSAAYDAYKHVIKQSPTYELEFNARIAMTEVMPGTHAKQKLSKLKAMARSDKNKDYMDQVYYAIGNIYLAERDTIAALNAYEKGNTESTRNGIEKGTLLLKLGDVYWDLERFGDASRCYGEAIGLLDQDRKDYEQLSYRAKVLEELAPHTEAVHLQDSLQALAKMSERERNMVIDKIISDLKKKEKEERLNQLDAEAQKNGAMGNINGQPQRQQNQQRPMPGQQNGTWYFYNTMAVQQGKQTFQQQWGKRENTDNWQRINKTIVASSDNVNSEGEMTPDSLAESGMGDISDMKTDSVATDSTANDPHKREYYLAQIPFTAEQLAESNMIIEDGLFNSGIIFKDKLDNLTLSEKAFARLTKMNPDFEKNDILYYHMFLLYSRKGEHQTARQFVDLLADKYPESEYTRIVTDPYFVENARFGTQLEDSLYAATYDAFLGDRHAEIAMNMATSEKRFPQGAHRDKFLFVGGLSRLNQGDADSCVACMERVVNEFPQSEVASMAGNIINGVKAGKRLHGAKFDINIWDYRADAMTEEKDTTVTFSDEPDQEFVFLMTYNPDSIGSPISPNNENQLLYELARYNFTSFLVRNFDISIDDYQGYHRLTISGFRSYEEAQLYAKSLYENERIMKLATGSHNLIISERNLQLLGTQLSYNDYIKFYEQHFLPIPVSDEQLLNEPVITPEQYDPENDPNAPAPEPVKVTVPQPVQPQADKSSGIVPPPVKKEETKKEPAKKEETKKEPAKKEVKKNDEYFEFDGF